MSPPRRVRVLVGVQSGGENTAAYLTSGLKGRALDGHVSRFSTSTIQRFNAPNQGVVSLKR